MLTTVSISTSRKESLVPIPPISSTIGLTDIGVELAIAK